MQPINIATPLTTRKTCKLRAGQQVLLSGTVYTARDAAHRRLVEMIGARQRLPFELQGAVIYYAGPTPTPPGRVVGSIGPTTSSRMDQYTPMLLEAGLKGMIGKGRRSLEVVAAIKQHRAVYFAAPGGAGAYLSQRVVTATVIAFPELGTEAICRLEVRDFPLTVINDCHGNDQYLNVMKGAQKK